MSRHIRTLVLVAVLAGLIVPLGCGDSNTPQIGRIDVIFTYKVGAAPFFPESLNYFLHPEDPSDGVVFSIDTLKYYVSRLRITGGSSFASDLIHRMDVTNQSSAYENVLSFTSVPAGNYKEITFTFGLDDEQNVAGALLSPDNDDMIWPEQMGDGYHYMKMEGRWIDAAGDTLTYLTHTGRTLQGSYFFTVTLPFAQFDLGVGKTMRIPINMDILQWYNNPNKYDFPTPPAIMGDDARQAVIQENGKNAVFIAGTPIPPDFEN